MEIESGNEAGRGKRKFENTKDPKDPNETPDTPIVNQKKVKNDNDANQIQDGFDSKFVHVIKRIPNEIQLEILSFVPPIPTFDELIEKKDLQMVCSFLENNKRNPDMYPVKLEKTVHDFVDNIIQNGLDDSCGFFDDKIATIRLDILRELLRHPKINAKSVIQNSDPFSEYFQYTMLHQAVEGANYESEVVKVILEEKGEELINLVTGVVFAGDPGHFRKMRGRHTALHLARHRKIVKLLMNTKGINPNATDDEGNTPLHIFVQTDHNDGTDGYFSDNGIFLIKKLFKCPDVDTSIRNKEGFLAIDLAPKNIRRKIERYNELKQDDSSDYDSSDDDSDSEED